MINRGFIANKDFFEIAILHKKPKDGKWFFTREELEFITKDGKKYIVPIGTYTDFASIPRSLRWLISRVGRYARAAVLHDWLSAEKIVSRKVADQIFLEAMESIGVNWFLRRAMYTAVRSYSIVTRKK